ncbi:MAG: hypothetical protein J6Z06_00450 [Lachnospiraceae bacterium]|nr:hypothetical protein [Lachnospiraceae bacterium]
MKKWILPALCVVLNIVLFVGNYKLHESNVAMHEENVAFYEQNVATQEAFEHRYDKYETTITDYTGLEEYPLKAEQSEANKYYEKREAMYMHAVSAPTDVVFVGDSITDRFAWEECYPDLVVKRRAIVGDTTAGVLSRTDSELATKPSKIFLLIGTNDLYQLSKEKELDEEAYQTVMNNYIAILDTYQDKAPKTEIYVESVLPMREMDESKKERKDYNELIQRFNKDLVMICEDHKVTYLNLWK